MEIRVQLDEGHKGDKYLRDSLGGSIDIPAIKGYLNDRTDRPSQQLINRVNTQLSGRPERPDQLKPPGDPMSKAGGLMNMKCIP